MPGRLVSVPIMTGLNLNGYLDSAKASYICRDRGMQSQEHELDGSRRRGSDQTHRHHRHGQYSALYFATYQYFLGVALFILAIDPL